MIRLAKEWGSTVLVSAFVGSLVPALFVQLFTAYISIENGLSLQPREFGELYIYVIVLIAGFGTFFATVALALFAVAPTIWLQKYVRTWWFLAAGAICGGLVGALVGVPLEAFALAKPAAGDLYIVAWLGAPIGFCTGISWVLFASQKVETLYSSAP